MKRVPSSTESPVLNTVFTSSRVTTSSAVGLSRILSLCTDMHRVKTKTNLSPFAVCYQVDSVFSSFFSDRWCAARNLFYFRTLMFFITLYLLCLQTLLIWVWAFSAGPKASHSVNFIDAQTFHNIFVLSHVFMNTFSKSMAVTRVFFGRFLYSASFEVAFYQS